MDPKLGSSFNFTIVKSINVNYRKNEVENKKFRAKMLARRSQNVKVYIQEAKTLRGLVRVYNTRRKPILSRATTLNQKYDPTQAVSSQIYDPETAGKNLLAY